MTAPEARPGGLDSNVRGLLVLGAAVLVGVLLLASWGDDGASKVATTDGKTTTTVDIGDLGTTTTAPTETTTTTPGSANSPSEVSVIVLNGSGQTGAAATNSSTIGDAGYTMLTPGNAQNIDSTTVYYADGYEADAIAVAKLLGKGTDAVKPLSDASLGGAEGDANVVVVLGADTPPVDSTTTTTTIG